MDTNTLFLIAQKARALQADYLCGVLVTEKTTKENMICPCGSGISWSRYWGECTNKCGHEFTIRSQEIRDDHVLDEDGDPVIRTEHRVYCRKKRPGHDTAIGELVGWWRVNIPIDSPYYAAFQYYPDAVFMVIGLDISGAAILVSPLDNEGHPETTDTGVAVDIKENTVFAMTQCFWLPIEYTGERSSWPFMEK